VKRGTENQHFIQGSTSENSMQWSNTDHRLRWFYLFFMYVFLFNDMKRKL
jgi:hypothetical protein